MEIMEIDKFGFVFSMPHKEAIWNEQITPIDFNMHSDYFNIMHTIGQCEDPNKHILKGVTLIAEYWEGICDKLAYVDKRLYIWDDHTLNWYIDTKRLRGLYTYFAFYMEMYDITLKEIRAVIEICIKFGFIAEMSRDDFETRVNTDKLRSKQT